MSTSWKHVIYRFHLRNVFSLRTCNWNRQKEFIRAKLGLENNGTEAISTESDVPVMIIP